MAAPTTLSPTTSASAAPIPSPTTFITASLAPRKETQVSVPLTKPYVYPPECTNIFRVGTPWAQTHGFARIEETFLYVDTSTDVMENHWKTCLPRGIEQEEFPFAEGYKYKAAVCPQGWMAFNVGYKTEYEYPDRGGGETITKTISSAGCCMSGHTYELDIWELYYSRSYNTKNSHFACAFRARDVDRAAYWDSTITLESKLTLGLSVYTTTTTSPKWLYDYSAKTYLTDEPTTTYTGTYTITTGTEVTVTNTLGFYGRAFYPAMSMEWEASDNASLDPPWPTLTSDMLIPSWAPEVAVHKGYENKGAGHDYRADVKQPATLKMKIAIPIISTLGGIIVLAILFVMWRRVRRTFKERRERKEKVAAAEYTAGTAQGLEMSDMGSTASLHESGAVAENVMPLEGEEVVRKKEGTRVGRWWRRKTTGEGVVPRVDLGERELPLGGASREGTSVV